MYIYSQRHTVWRRIAIINSVFIIYTRIITYTSHLKPGWFSPQGLPVCRRARRPRLVDAAAGVKLQGGGLRLFEWVASVPGECGGPQALVVLPAHWRLSVQHDRRQHHTVAPQDHSAIPAAQVSEGAGYVCRSGFVVF